MCTAVSYKTQDHYFGRNMDYEYSYEERITITPRNYEFRFRKAGTLKKHYAMIGTAYVVSGYPLYYEGVNEQGLAMAGLNFPGNAVYYEAIPGKDNIAPFEFIPWVLSQCDDIKDTKELLEKINLVNISFSRELPLSPLHWIISDSNTSIVVETTEDGMKIYDNATGVLTNNPPFPYHMYNLTNYMGLTRNTPEASFSGKLELRPYSRGMGTIGLPGDLSSSGRFVKAVFTKENSVSGSGEMESVSQFFHILEAVGQQRGLVKQGAEEYEITIYSCCCNTNKGIYYYKTYDSQVIRGINMYHENLDGHTLISYPMLNETYIEMQN